MPTMVNRQVNRARRRLFLDSLLTLLGWSWVAALGLAVVWFFVQPLLFGEVAEWVRWAVAGGLLAGATVFSVVLAMRSSPSPVSAALRLDERFGSKERVTTAMTLSSEDAARPAGKMLLDDAEKRVAGLPLNKAFPVRLPWRPAAAMPVLGGALALLVMFWGPRINQGDAGEDLANAPVSRDAKNLLEQQMKKLAVLKRPDKEAPALKDAKDLLKLEREIEQFTQKPRDTREDIRDRIKDATQLEAEIQKQQREEEARVDALKEQIKQQNRLDKERERPKDGPAKDAMDAVSRGDFERARNELNELSKKLEEEEKREKEKERLKRKQQDPKAGEEEKKKAKEDEEKLDEKPKMTKEEKEKLNKQLKEMENQLERLTRSKAEKEKDLRDKADKGEIDKEQLARELEQLKKNNEALNKDDLKDLKDAAEKLKEARKALNKDEDKDKEKGEEKEKEKEKGKGKDKEKEGDKEKGKDKEKGEDKEKGKDKEKDKGKGEDKDKDKEKSKEGDKEKGQDKEKGKDGDKEKDKEKGKDGDKEKGQGKEKGGDKQPSRAERLKQAADSLDKVSGEEKQKVLAERKKEIANVRKSLAKSLSNKDGDSGDNGGGVGAGKRPISKDAKTDFQDLKLKSDWDKGKLTGVGYGPLGGFKGPKLPSALKSEIQQAAQKAPAAIDRQRLPASKRNMAKGYFEQLRADEQGKK